MKYGMAILFIILSSFILIGCNPVKRVLKNQEQFEKIGNVWALKNPCINDTVVNFIKGDTIINERVIEKRELRIDTLNRIDSFFTTKIIEREILIRDTLVNTITDKRTEEELKKQITQKNGQIITIGNKVSTKQKKIEELKQKLKNRFWMMIAMGTGLISSIILLIKKW